MKIMKLSLCFELVFFFIWPWVQIEYLSYWWYCVLGADRFVCHFSSIAAKTWCIIKCDICLCADSSGHGPFGLLRKPNRWWFLWLSLQMPRYSYYNGKCLLILIKWVSNSYVNLELNNLLWFWFFIYFSLSLSPPWEEGVMKINPFCLLSTTDVTH